MPGVLDQLKKTLAQRYAVEREIGRGGMATVYLARDLKHRRRVAIKVLSPEISAAVGRDRFLREIEIAAGLTHPHILPLFDSGAAGDLLFYVTPFVDGDSLRARLDRERQLPLEDALRIAHEITSGLSYAHGRGIIHRDIKPENILLSEGVALIADFGIARAVSGGGSDGLTVTGVSLGTPRYMSPEQALGASELDGRSDLYSLGCVLYEMLAGEPPFSGTDPRTVQAQHAHDPVPPLRTRRPGVSEAIERVIVKALSKAPVDRHGSAVQLAEALSLATSSAQTPLARPREVTVPTNLPSQRTSFVGRQRELAECARFMGETRLLTLTGVGGSGKTRLAIKLAENLMESFPEGSWFVDLAPLTEGTRLPGAVAAVLGVKEKPDRDLSDAIAQSLAGKRSLLLLDNCEHLLSECADLTNAILGAGSEVKILATSREGLGIEGERLVAVGPLAVPRAEDGHGDREIETSDAVRLFSERARAVVQGFELTEKNASTVAEICRRLDGVPLAIELAAARARMLSVEEIRDRLSDRFRLLTGGRRTALPRHRTLRAAIQWSYDQLTEEEQEQFCALSVFSGGWTLESATRVTGGDKDDFEVLELMTHLLDKSLLLIGRRESGETRYRQLETIRQFAQDRLEELDQFDHFREKHFRYFAGLAERTRPLLESEEREKWRTILRPDLDNFRIALEWGFAERPAEAAVMATMLGYFWDVVDGYSEGRAWLEKVLIEVEGVPKEIRAQALGDASILDLRRGNLDAAERNNRESLALSRELGDKKLQARSLRRLGTIASQRRRYEEALVHEEESLALFRELGHKSGELSLRNNMAVNMIGLKRYQEARKILKDVLVLRREEGKALAIEVGLQNLGVVELAMGRVDSARSCLVEALDLCRRHDIRLGTAHALAPMAAVLRLEKKLEHSACMLGATASILERLDAVLETLELSIHERTVAQLRDELGGEEFDEAFARGQSMTTERAIDLCLEPVQED